MEKELLFSRQEGGLPKEEEPIDWIQISGPINMSFLARGLRKQETIGSIQSVVARQWSQFNQIQYFRRFNNPFWKKGTGFEQILLAINPQLDTSTLNRRLAEIQDQIWRSARLLGLKTELGNFVENSKSLNPSPELMEFLIGVYGAWIGRLKAEFLNTHKKGIEKIKLPGQPEVMPMVIDISMTREDKILRITMTNRESARIEVKTEDVRGSFPLLAELTRAQFPYVGLSFGHLLLDNSWLISSNYCLRTSSLE